MKDLYKLLEGMDYVFFNGQLVDITDIEEEMENYFNNYVEEESDFAEMEIIRADKVSKPSLSFDSIEEMLESQEFYSEECFPNELIEQDQEALDKINEILHEELIKDLYEGSKTLFNVRIYANRYEIMENEE